MEAISQLSGDISLAAANSGHAAKTAYNLETDHPNRRNPVAARDVREWGSIASLATLSTEAIYNLAYTYADSTGRAGSASTITTIFEKFDASFFEAVQSDADNFSDSLIDTPLWRGMVEPAWLQDIAPHAKRITQQRDEWAFWRDWYQGFLDGKPLDWELQRRVALIPDEDWEKGPEHIAKKIEEIREGFGFERAARQKRYKELEPSSVDHLLSAPTINAAQIEAAAHDINEASCRYLNDTGANELPEAFQMFPTLSRSLLAISRRLRESELTPSKEGQLRQEIGRLNAHVRELEKQIAKLQASGDPVFRTALKEQAARSLGDWKMYAAMLGAVWMISGDTVGVKARLENLAAARDAIFGASNTRLVEPTDEL